MPPAYKMRRKEPCNQKSTCYRIGFTLHSLLICYPKSVSFLDLLLGVFTQLQTQFNDCRNTIPSGSNAAIRFEQDQNCMMDIVHTLL